MSKRKICAILTMRASYAKFKPILDAIHAHDDLELQLVRGASAVLERFGYADKVAERDGFIVSERVFCVLEGQTLQNSAVSTGLGIIEFAACFDRLKPDAVMVLGDRYEIMSAALAASYMNIPLVHVQGGEVSGNIDEKVRHAVTKLADVHFPATQRAADYIVRMGENPDYVFNTGCPCTDVCQIVLDDPEPDFDLYKKYGGVGSFPDLSQGYYIVMQHPVTTEYGSSRAQIEETLHAVSRLSRPVLWFWPNVDAGGDDVSKGIRSFRENHLVPFEHLHFLKNMQPLDFLRTLNRSLGLIGNSSAGIRETSYLGVPSVNIGSRQNARERGHNVIDVGYDRDEIYNAIQSHCGVRKERSTIYGDGKAGPRIADLLTKVGLHFDKVLHYTTEDANPLQVQRASA